MELSKAAMASSPSPSSGQLLPRSGVESQHSSLVYDLSQQVQLAMENMLKMINEIDQNSTGIVEEIEKSLHSAHERKTALEDEKDCFRKAAYSVLDVLNNRETR